MLLMVIGEEGSVSAPFQALFVLGDVIYSSSLRLLGLLLILGG